MFARSGPYIFEAVPVVYSECCAATSIAAYTGLRRKTAKEMVLSTQN